MNTFTLLSPAKLNLFLHIIGRREDGYHQLQTVFQLLEYGDKLTFSPSDQLGIQLSHSIPNLVDEDNLIIKAARLLQEKYAITQGASIRLDKLLPMGGGLGGGSSNAATTLLGLNHLWRLGLTLGELASLGVQLGADVPVFVHGKTAWAEGIGEQLAPVELPEKWYLVVIPDCHVSTVEIFAHPHLTRDTHPIKIRAFLEQGGRNDCQGVVESLFPQVLEARQWLDKFAPAQMTGTGACVYARFDDKAKAEDALLELPKALKGFVAKGVNQSPAHHQILSYS